MFIEKEMYSFIMRFFFILVASAFLCIPVAFSEELQQINVGDSFFFGIYEQDNNLENGSEEIEWLVLEVKDDKALLISKNGLDSLRYNQKPYLAHWERVVWEKSDIRKWLNKDFYNTAFSDEEKKQILKTVVKNGFTKYSGIDGGADTVDNVFLISIEEAESLFSGNNERVCFATPYATEKGAWTEYNKSCWWWLRSPGEPLEYAAHIFINGEIHVYGNRLSGSGGTIRPSIWINLEKLDCN